MNSEGVGGVGRSVGWVKCLSFDNRPFPGQRVLLTRTPSTSSPSRQPSQHLPGKGPEQGGVDGEHQRQEIVVLLSHVGPFAGERKDDGCHQAGRLPETPWMERDPRLPRRAPESPDCVHSKCGTNRKKSALGSTPDLTSTDSIDTEQR